MWTVWDSDEIYGVVWVWFPRKYTWSPTYLLMIPNLMSVSFLKPASNWNGTEKILSAKMIMKWKHYKVHSKRTGSWRGIATPWTLFSVPKSGLWMSWTWLFKQQTWNQSSGFPLSLSLTYCTAISNSLVQLNVQDQCIITKPSSHHAAAVTTTTTTTVIKALIAVKCTQ